MRIISDELYARLVKILAQDEKVHHAPDKVQRALT